MERIPLIIAHRGASALEKENTLAAFEKAIELNADMVELDVRRSQDGVLLVHHDKHIVREGRLVRLRDLLYRDVRECRPEIPTLESVLELCAGKIALDIEVKETGYEEQILDLAAKYLQPQDFVVTSFNDSAIKAVRKAKPEVATGLLLGHPGPKNAIVTRLSELFPLARYRNCGASFLAPHYRLINRLFLRMTRTHNIPLFVWTVNHIGLMKNLFTLGVHAVITDRPEIALQVRRELFGSCNLQPTSN